MNDNSMISEMEAVLNSLRAALKDLYDDLGPCKLLDGYNRCETHGFVRLPCFVQVAKERIAEIMEDYI